MLFLLQKLKLLSLPVSYKEKKAQMPSNFPQKLPGPIAALASHQFKKLKRFNNFRVLATKLYRGQIKGEAMHPPNVNGGVWLRYPVQVSNAKSLIDYAKERGILIGDWYKQSIYPIKDLNLLNYKSDCENVERLQNRVVNLPTYPTMTEKQVDTVINIVTKWQRSQQQK